MTASLPGSPRASRRRLILPLAILALLSIPRALAGADRPPPAPAAGEGGPGSPREAVVSYLEAARQGRWDAAAEALELPPDLSTDGPRLARRLKAVLDRHAWIDPAELSESPGGNLEDGLPPNVEEIARIPGRSGSFDPVRLVLREGPEGPRWLVSPATVRRVDRWYEDLGQRWLLEHAPEALLRPGPKDLLVWQWLALPLVAAVALAIGAFLSLLTRALVGRLAARTETTLDDVILARLRAPITIAWTLVVAAVPLAYLGLYEPAERFLDGVRRTGLFLVLFWGALRTVDVLQAAVGSSPWASRRPEARALLPLSARLVKTFLVVLAGVALLGALGYPVASLVAGLGIGGIAVALAAQKTVENLFGSLSIGVDQALSQGDWVKVGDVFGVVESVGLRSTRIRTLDRTLVTIPNGGLADTRIESYTARDRLRLSATIGLVYDTTQEQMKVVLEGFERVLRQHPKIWGENVVVFFTGFGDSSLNVDVMAWFLTTDWGEFQRIRQEVFLAFMGVVESAESSFAFPTRTVHVVPGAGAAAPPPRG